MTVAKSINSIAGAAIARNDAKPAFQVGQRAEGPNGAVFLYVKFTPAVAVGDVVQIDKDFNATLVTTAASARGALVGAVVATAAGAGESGWVQRAGQALVKAAAAVAANTRLNTTATGGALDDDGAVGAKHIEGVAFNGAVGGAGTAEASLNYPTVGVTL